MTGDCENAAAHVTVVDANLILSTVKWSILSLTIGIVLSILTFVVLSISLVILLLFAIAASV